MLMVYAITFTLYERFSLYHSDCLIISSVRNYISIGAYADDFVLSESSWTMLQTIMTHAGELEGTVAYTDAVNTKFASALNEA